MADASIPGPYSTSGSAVVYIFLWLTVELTVDPGPSRLTPWLPLPELLALLPEELPLDVPELIPGP